MSFLIETDELLDFIGVGGLVKRCKIYEQVFEREVKEDVNLETK